MYYVRKYEELVLMLYINQKYLHLSILFLYYDIKFIKKDHKEGKLLAEKAECEGQWNAGYEGWKGYLSDVDSCAKACNGEFSMFTFGTNDFGFKGCRYNETVHDTLYDGCECRCQILTHPNGTCKQGLSGSPENRLYKIQKGKIIVIGTCDKSHNMIDMPILFQ